MWLDDDMEAAHHSGPSDTGYLRFERGGGEGGIRGVGEGLREVGGG